MMLQPLTLVVIQAYWKTFVMAPFSALFSTDPTALQIIDVEVTNALDSYVHTN